MRNLPTRPVLARPQPHPRPAAKRGIGPGIRKAGRGGGVVLVSILFWLIFYQSLPAKFGLNNPLAQQAAQQAALGAPQAPEDLTAVSEVGAANTLNRSIKLIMIVISLAVIASRWSLTRQVARNINPGFAAIVVLAPLSAAWSINPSATLLRFITLVSIVLVCFAVAVARWDRQRLQQMVIPPVMYILLMSLVLGSIYPDRVTEIGTDVSQKGAWHGITHFKNIFGMTSSIGVILCINRYLAREGRALWNIAGAIAAFTCLLFSRSNTSLLATLVCVFFMVLVMRVPAVKQRYSAHVVIGLAATLLFYELLIQDVIPGVNMLLSPITGLFGKDVSFSARTIIWNVVKQHMQGAPYLGTGYGAYWVYSPTSPSWVFQYLMFFWPSESHNGYLEMMNDFGYLGLACLLVFLSAYIRQALQLMRFDRSQAALYLALLFEQMIMNMSESEWFSLTSTFAVLILATFCMSRALVEHRLQAQAAGIALRQSG